jgi:hypothetical protein
MQYIKNDTKINSRELNNILINNILNQFLEKTKY